jgi:hypothetical protein
MLLLMVEQVILLPPLLAWRLFSARKHHSLSNPVVLARYGILFDTYRSETFW